MLAGVIGISSPGLFAPGAIAYPVAAGTVQPAPFDRSFVYPANGLPWEGFKTPQESSNFSFNWVDEIGEDLIASSAWALESSDITQQLAAVDSSGTIATILLSGGVAGNLYNVTNTIITQTGLKLSATFRLSVNNYNR